MIRPPAMPKIPEQPSQTAPVFGSDAWKSSVVAVQIDEHAKQLIGYAVLQLHTYRTTHAANRLAERQKTDKGTARQRELQRLYSSTGLRERIWELLERLAVENAPPHHIC